MTPHFTVFITAHCERDLAKLERGHAELREVYPRVLAILKPDPYNHSRSHAIRKLEDVQPGNGQWRLRWGRFRFRYDIEGSSVYLKACSLRREDTY